MLPGSSEREVYPVRLVAANIVGFIDAIDEAGELQGWVHRLDSEESVVLAIVEDGREIGSFVADDWRADLAELRRGAGSCGFKVELPAELRDGNVHEIDLRLADADASVLQKPLTLVLASREPAETAPPRRPKVAPLVRGPERVELSIVVNFYNMRREAERTLTSLTRAYQRGSDSLAYEVIVIDNGSAAPLDAAWVASFGPQFRLFDPRVRAASPCAALNLAALVARGRHLAIMIDGAHVLTPGVFRETMAVLERDPEAVVALRHWFVGGDQRWLARIGYTREMEDKLFKRIRWPRDGYALFSIGTSIGESPDPWFGALNESNCLIVPTALFDAIGGMDESFSEPAGGFANLDLMRRVTDAAPGDIVALVGEATFHQFHGGTTTNVTDDDKDVLVRSYARHYRQLRGEDFAPVPRSRIRVSGAIHTDEAFGQRQRQLLPLTLGLTERTREAPFAEHFDPGTTQHLQLVYAECGLFESTTWLGQRVDLAPGDLVNIADLIREVRPGAIVTTSADDGLIRFLDSQLTLTGLDGARIVCVREHAGPEFAHVVTVRGAPYEAATLAAVRRAAGASDAVLVLFAPGLDTFPVAALHAYAKFVTHRSYLVFLGSVFGQPWLGYSCNWYLSAIRSFVRSSPFKIDTARDRHVLTVCPSGYLQRVGGVELPAYDPSLDDLERFELTR